MNEREAKLKAIKVVTDCLNNAPLKPEFSGIYWNQDHMAEEILRLIEQVEREYEYAR